MQISTLENHPQIQHNKVLADTHAKFAKLLNELERRTLPEDVINSINRDVEQANAFKGTDSELTSQLKKCQASVLKLIEKKLNLVSKKHYQKLWFVVGLATFGIPLGFAFGLALHNMAFLGTGFPVGMCIGLAVGAGMDKKARARGNQLDFEN